MVGDGVLFRNLLENTSTVNRQKTSNQDDIEFHTETKIQYTCESW